MFKQNYNISSPCFHLLTFSFVIPVLALVRVGNIVGAQRFHLLYLTAIPRLITMGLKPEEVVAKFEVRLPKFTGLDR